MDGSSISTTFAPDDPALPKRKQRLKSPPKRKTAIKNPHKSPHWATREGPIADLRRKLCRQKLEEKVWGPRRRKEVPAPREGIPDGFNRETATAMWAEARASAEKTMKELIENEVFVSPDAPGYTTDDAAAVEAMTETLTIMRSASHKDLRLKAASQVLTFTKAKPEQRVKATVQSAEDWLNQVIQADKATPATTEANEPGPNTGP